MFRSMAPTKTSTALFPPTLKNVCGECVLCMIHLEQNWLKQCFLWLGELSEAGHGGLKLVVIPVQLLLSC